MLRLNNKDFTVEEVERLMSLTNDLINGSIIGCDDALDVKSSEIDALKELLKGTTIRNETNDKPFPILWNFKFQFMMVPIDFEMAKAIKYAMWSTEVNQNIERRFSAMCREEIDWFINGVDIFSMPGNDSTFEDKHD